MKYFIVQRTIQICYKQNSYFSQISQEEREIKLTSEIRFFFSANKIKYVFGNMSTKANNIDILELQPLMQKVANIIIRRAQEIMDAMSNNLKIN